MRKLIFICLFINFSYINLAQWIQQKDFLPKLGPGRKIDACDTMHAILYGDLPNNQGMFITRDGGKTWNPIIIPEGRVIDLSIVNKDYIWYVTNNNVYHSYDGGLSWSLQKSFNLQLIYLKMFNLYEGIIVSDADPNTKIPLILRTANGGIGHNGWLNECNQSIGSATRWQRTQFLDFSTGFYFAAINDSKLYKTKDKGKTWNNINFFSYAMLIKFYNENIGLILANNYPDPYKLYRTFDGGATWDSSFTNFTAWPGDFEFLPGEHNKVWYVDTQSLFYSSNFGKTWNEHKLLQGNLNGRDLVFVDNKHGWLLCDDGKVFYTNNNGGLISEVYLNDDMELPNSIMLFQNYPNPFNPTTRITYSLPENSFVSLKIYDILGREIKSLIASEIVAGNHSIEWNGSDNFGNKVASGTYIYKFSVGTFFSVKKMLLIK